MSHLLGIAIESLVAILLMLTVISVAVAVTV